MDQQQLHDAQAGFTVAIALILQFIDQADQQVHHRLVVGGEVPVVVPVGIVHKVAVHPLDPQHDPLHRVRGDGLFHVLHAGVDDHELPRVHQEHGIPHVELAVTPHAEENFQKIVGVPGAVPLFLVPEAGNIQKLQAVFGYGIL